MDGVETGSVLTPLNFTDADTTAGNAERTQIAPGSHTGQVVLTVTAETLVPFQRLSFPFRQALYVDATGVVVQNSVLAAIRGSQVGTTLARDVAIRSTGQAFDGFRVEGGSYTVRGADIALRGNGRSDFVGYGAAVKGNGAGTRLVIDGAQIRNAGVVRTGVVADGGSNVVVKN